MMLNWQTLWRGGQVKEGVGERLGTYTVIS